MLELSRFEGVVVIYNDTDQLIKGETQDLISEQDVVKCAAGIADALRSRSIRTELAPIRGEAEHVLKQFDPNRWLVFNLAEGSGGRIYEESRIAWMLEIMGYHFTGSTGRAIALTTNKSLTKSFLSRAGIATPRWWVFHSPDQIPNEAALPFPLFVKPVAEDASLGISDQSIVRDTRSLREQVAYILERYKQSALVEEFITGREINAAAWGDPLDLLPLAEIDFSDFDQPETGIVNYAAKWQDESFEYHHTPAICPANLKPRLEKKIRRYVLSAIQCSGVSSYTRVDLRIAEDDTPYILEINANPDISRGAGFFRAVEQTGLTYEDMALNILTSARRHSDDYCSFRRSR